MKLEPLSEDVVERALAKLKLDYFRDDRGVLKLQWPNALCLFVFGEDLLTLRTQWTGSIGEQERLRALELLNNINAQAPTGKVVPIVGSAGERTVEFREHYFLRPAVALGQLVLIFDAYFSIMTSIFDDLDTMFPAVEEGEQ